MNMTTNQYNQDPHWLVMAYYPHFPAGEKIKAYLHYEKDSAMEGILENEHIFAVVNTQTGEVAFSREDCFNRWRAFP